LEVAGGVVFMPAEGIGEALEVDEGGADLVDSEADAFNFFIQGVVYPGAGAIGLWCGALSAPGHGRTSTLTARSPF
jgi:hypothetical protein